MERVIVDSYIKGKKQTIGEDINCDFNQRVLAVNRVYGFLYDKGILEKVAFVYRDCPDETYFALDVKGLEPYRQELQNSEIEDAALAVRHIFDEPYTPCSYCGAIQPGWVMMNYREVDGCVGRSCECDLVKWLNTQAVQDIFAVKAKQGVKAAVRKVFSYYNWPEQTSEKKTAFADVVENAEARASSKRNDGRAAENAVVLSGGERE